MEKESREKGSIIMIHTVLGDITAEDAGVILSHEHILCCSHAMKTGFGDKWFNTKEVIDIGVELLKQVKRECGVNTIVDGTPLNLGRDIKLLQEISRRSGVHIIASTGLYYTEDYFLRAKSPELLASYFIDECFYGTVDTGVKPNFLKCATNDQGVTELNEKSLLTMGIVQKETGLPLYAHNYHCSKTAYDQIRVFERCKANFEKIVIGHCSDTNDITYLEDLLKQGVYVGFDRIFEECYHKAKTICTLIERGWEDKLLFSHDFYVFIDSQNYTWEERKKNIFNSNHSLMNVHKKLIPHLREMGVSDNQIYKALHDNPIKLLTLTK